MERKRHGQEEKSGGKTRGKRESKRSLLKETGRWRGKAFQEKRQKENRRDGTASFERTTFFVLRIIPTLRSNPGQ